tara:strand:+ start:149 stop:457 length:309 start_codon:yes stop_codon:yes gene_type:complete
MKISSQQLKQIIKECIIKEWTKISRGEFRDKVRNDTYEDLVDPEIEQGELHMINQLMSQLMTAAKLKKIDIGTINVEAGELSRALEKLLKQVIDTPGEPSVE